MSSINKIIEPETDSGLSDSANYGSRTPSGNARLFNCKQCNRAFTREEHLTRHTLSTHNKLKPFVCGICHRPFSRRDLLLRHAKNLHQGSERAVSRIRKSYKRSVNNEILENLHSSDASSGDTYNENGKETSGEVEEMIDQNLEESQVVQSSPQMNNIIPRDSQNLLKKDFDSSDKKRMKMSVNMLVS